MVLAAEDGRARRFDIWRSALLRYLLLGPAALSILANVDDVGAFAAYLVSSWRPFLEAVGIWVFQFQDYLRQLGIEIDLDADVVVPLLFFLPFSVEGAFRLVSLRQTSLPFVIGAPAPFFALLFTIALDNDAGAWGASDFLLMAAFGLVGAVAVYAVAAVMARRWWSNEIPTIAVPSATFILMSLFGAVSYLLAAEDHGVSFWLIFAFAALLTLPTLAPRRLLEVFCIVAAVVAISVAYSMIAPLIGLTA